MFVDSVKQHAMRMYLLSSVACPALQYFYTLFHKGTVFEGGVKVCELIFTTTIGVGISQYNTTISKKDV